MVERIGFHRGLISTLFNDEISTTDSHVGVGHGSRAGALTAHKFPFELAAAVTGHKSLTSKWGKLQPPSSRPCLLKLNALADSHPIRAKMD
jgi:hypothetical protein